MGGTKSADCNRIAQKIWKWAIEEKIWITAAFVPGKENKTADEKSRKLNEAIEWMLNPDIFLKITTSIMFIYVCCEAKTLFARGNTVPEQFLVHRTFHVA